VKYATPKIVPPQAPLVSPVLQRRPWSYGVFFGGSSEMLTARSALLKTDTEINQSLYPSVNKS
jgi:hypothetical protein